MRRKGRVRFEELYWHDGIFEGLRVIAPAKRTDLGRLELEVSLYPLDLSVPYPDQSVTARAAFTVTFAAAEKVALSCDMADLAFNGIFGNTDRVRTRTLKGGRRRITLVMFGGELSLTCKSIAVARR